MYKPKASAFKDHGWGPELAVIACQRVKASSCLKRSFPANSGRTRRIFESPILAVPPRPRCSVHAILGTRRRSTELLYTRLGSSAFPQLPYALTMTMLHFSPPSFFWRAVLSSFFFAWSIPLFPCLKKRAFQRPFRACPLGHSTRVSESRKSSYTKTKTRKPKQCSLLSYSSSVELKGRIYEATAECLKLRSSFPSSVELQDLIYEATECLSFCSRFQWAPCADFCYHSNE